MDLTLAWLSYKNICFFDQLLATFMALHVFLSQFKVANPYPATSIDPQEFLHAGQWFRSRNATHHDARYDVNNSSNLLLSQFEHAHVRTARQVTSGCVKSKYVQQCGKDLILTVECKKRSITCISFQNNARCVTEKSYFPACGKVFNTNCLCQGQSGWTKHRHADFYVKASQKLFKLMMKNRNALQRTLN